MTRLRHAWAAILIGLSCWPPAAPAADRIPVWARVCRPLPDGDRPIPLSGKLAVTFVDQGIPEAEGDPHEVGIYDLAHPEHGLRRLTRNRDNEAEVEISPDGKQMLYTARPALDDFNSDSELWLAPLEGSGPPRRIAAGEPMGVPAWHQPGGEGFSFIQWGDESGDSKLYEFLIGPRLIRPLLPQIEGAADPEMSYDGRWLVFKKMIPGEHADQPSIWLIRRDGTGLRRLTGHDKPVSDHDPVFSRDGRKVYFERYYGPGDWFEASQARGEDPRHNWWGIVEVDIASRRERVVVPYDPTGCHFYWLPTVSPDGKALMMSHVDVWAGDRKPPRAWTDLRVMALPAGPLQKVPGSDWFYFFDWGP